MIGKALAGLCAAFIGLAAVPSHAADPIADFYKDKQIRIISGSAPGGGYDLYARTVAQYLGKFLPGHPTIIVQNMPGAGSMNAINAVAVAMPQDGTVIVAPQAGAIFSQISGNPAAQFDAVKMNWIGSLNEETAWAITWHTSKVKTFDDLTKHESIFGTSGPNVTVNLPRLFFKQYEIIGSSMGSYQEFAEVTKLMAAAAMTGLKRRPKNG